MSDISAVRSEDDARSALESLAAQLAADLEANGNQQPAAASSASSLTPEMAAQMRTFRDQAIATLQDQLAKTDAAKNRDQYKALQDALAQTRTSYAQLLGETAASANPAAAPETKTWRIPAFGTKQPDLATALADLQRLVTDNATAEALRGFRESPDYTSASRCAAAAGVAFLLHRDVAALAGWIRAHELDAQAPEPLLNLAALTVRIGLPRHTLTLLDAAEKRLKSGRIGPLEAQAVVLNHRGQALVLLRRFPEAEKLLREAVRLEPSLSEARINLAHALYQQGDTARKKEAVSLMVFARRGMAQAATKPDATSTSPATSPPGDPSTNPIPPTAMTAEEFASRHGRPFARDVFDLSRGKPGSIATIKIPRTIADAFAMWPAVKKLKAEVSQERAAVTNRMLHLNGVMRKRAAAGGFGERLAYARAQSIFRYIESASSEPELRELWQAYAKSSMDPLIGIYAGQYDNPWGSRELQEKLDRIPHTDDRAYCEAWYRAIEPYHATWLGPIHTLDTDVNRYARKLYPHVTAIAANLSDPVYREYAMLEIRSQMLTLTMGFIVPLEAVCRYQHMWLADCGSVGRDGTAADPVAASYPEPDSCPGGLRGDYSVGLNLELFSLGLNCEKVGVELSAGLWIKGFLAVDQNFDGSGCFFVGVAGDSSVPVVGVLGISATLKGGLYLVVDKEGDISDFGLRASRTSTVGLGPVSYSQELSNDFSLVSALPN